MNEVPNTMDLLNNPVRAINIGLVNFYDGLAEQGVDSIHLDWQPPAGGDASLLQVLIGLEKASLAEHIVRANQLAVERIIAGNPVIEDVAPAIEVVPGMTRDTILHAGPPIRWEEMPAAMRGAVVAALLFEGRVDSPEKAVELAQSGAMNFTPCHDRSAVGAMSGVTTASMPVFVARNRAYNNVAFCAWREIGQASGSYSPEVIQKMHWLRDVAMPGMRAMLSMRGGIELKPLLAQGLLMGDEHHNRVLADTANFTRLIAHSLVRAMSDARAAAEVLEYFASFDLATVPVIMAACKCIMGAVEGIEYSTVLTAISRNGRQDAIRVSGLPGMWFTGPAPKVEGIYHSGFSQEDAAFVMGDSPIIECAGFGGLSIAASPAHVTVRDNPGEAEQHTRDMYAITLAKNPGYPIPALDFEGVPVGIDLRRVIETGILPISNNPAAHKDPLKHTGVIGFGMSRPPMEAFRSALLKFAECYADG